MGGLLQDFRFAVRALRRTPIVFAAAVLTLAAGTGLATGVFAVAYGVLLRPLPFPNPDRLVTVRVFIPGFEGRGGVPLQEVLEWRRRARAFEGISSYATGDFTLGGAGEPRTVRGTMVTEGFFETFRLGAAEGNTSPLSAGEQVTVLSAHLADQIGRNGPWRQRGLTIGPGDFGAAAIMPPAFAFPDTRTDLWVRAEAVPPVSLFSSADQRRFTMVGRLAEGVTFAQARDDALRVVAEIDALTPARERRTRTAVVDRLDDRQRQGARTAVLPFLAGAVVVLLIACANVSGLLVGRAIGRQREFAVRRALGGGPGHVLRASLAESFTVSLLGWAAGLWLAWLVVRVFASRAASAIPNLQAVQLDAPVLAASFVLAMFVALVSGGAPALRALRTNPNTALKQTSDRIGRGGRLFRGSLVVGQIALTIVLLIAAGLLTRTVARIAASDRGFDAREAMAMRLMLTQTVRFNVTDRAPFINRLVERTRALPGVMIAGVGSDLPPGNNQLTMTISLVDQKRGINEVHNLGWASATPGYLEAIGAELVAGRLFEERDRLASPPSIVVTQSAARALMGDRDPVGRDWPAGIPTGGGKRPRPRVIGVVRDIKYGGLDRSTPALTMFVQWEHLAPGNAHLVARTAGAPETLAPMLRRLVRELDPTLPVFTPQTLEEAVSESLSERRLRLQLAVAFALLAIALAAIALWGAVAQTVLDRRHELAVRLALGATERNAVRLMLRGGFVLIALGLVIGGVAGAAAARALRHFLHGVSPADPPTFAIALAIATAISAIACYLPARRAASISPAELLRDA